MYRKIQDVLNGFYSSFKKFSKRNWNYFDTRRDSNVQHTISQELCIFIGDKNLSCKCSYTWSTSFANLLGFSISTEPVNILEM